MLGSESRYTDSNGGGGEGSDRKWWVNLGQDIVIGLAIVVVIVAAAYYILGTVYREVVSAAEVERAKAEAIDRSNTTLYNLLTKYGNTPYNRWDRDDQARWVCAQNEITEIGKIPYGGAPTLFRR